MNPILALVLIALALNGCALYHGSGLRQTWNVFRPLDDVQQWEGLFGPPLEPRQSRAKTPPPHAIAATQQHGFYLSPYAGAQHLIDARHLPPGTLIRCPYSKRILRIPPKQASHVPPRP